MPTYTGEILPEIITHIDVDAGIVQTQTTEVIYKDGVELTRINKFETINTADDNVDLDSKLADSPDELDYIKKLKQKRSN